ncbi:G-protein coupled receptor 55-like [Bombina bombina]|uniref:G-protein coupled receptor 55-like n=1 Tax=Bombina bombina TaxID=8345 RepID=UPI00235A5BC9|nr:G-protein coupled receptor 55-like [Bombina bombina]
MNRSDGDCSFSEVNSIVNGLQLAFYIPIFIVGLALNIIALRIFCFSLKKFTEATIFLINLAVLDLLLILSLPFKMYFSKPNATGNWRLCNFVECLYFTNMYGSIYTIMFISVDRYIAIRHLFWSKLLRSPTKTKTICVVIWIFVWTVSISVFSFNNGDQENMRCFHNMSDSIWSTPIIISLETIGFLGPLTVMMYCSIQIIRTLLTDRFSQEQNSRERIIVIRIIIINLVVFLVSFTPSHIAIFLQFLVRKHVISDCYFRQKVSLFLQMALCIANSNCCLDAVCYYFAVEEFRNSSIKKDSIIPKRTVSLRSPSIE